MIDEKVKIDIVSDIVCPWCIIGYKRLEAAIEKLKMQDMIEIQWQPFELNPNMPLDGENLRSHVARKYGANKNDSDKARNNIKSLGAEYNFQFEYFEQMKIVNTRDAHILLEYAYEKNLQHSLKQRLFKAFFSEQKDISDRETLLTEAQSIGISILDATKVLEDTKRESDIIKQEKFWQAQGITGVPTIVFDRQSALTGAHPEETYIEILSEIKEKLTSIS